MRLSFRNTLFLFQKYIACNAESFLLKRNYAAPNLSLGKKGKLGKKIGPTATKKLLPVETDVSKLLTFVCGSNIYKEGKDVEIKPDSEYPDWLWKIHTGPPIPLEELDRNTKAYWRKLRRMGMQRNNKIAALRRF